ncbi:MAG: hypothetical protein ABJN73_11325 [Nonlabens ulvanivorans]|uniref:Uncharacterized protein n=2 Tax=Nonlabens ulvanivorans TaxID=906888 RepID=A0A081DC84_NONUL|nr:hypothetical protein [Nonlabens ulvanivorans]KEZ94170.1 hypothetical protein IL45_03200 [Nonlabens ulvanivorans]PRX13159.1 hypothetical protein LY02_02220 [Nonlabens ulvanivorans]WOI21745.1 hypothetical protein R1T42_08615 [Nonlabens ulvanivorans]GAK76530.1 hypothetical protein JCM19296_2127 [Nonlabens ulvanivorans]GAK89835.1 hypothetical protein JCM19297_457 [Nonlabens ulvanivorans]|tara:strand:+ start:133 stop:570 length:438 start_codon:yes stop_codon:yes gene_type:complete
MRIEEAQQTINSYRVLTTDRKSLKLLDKWNELLIEVKNLDLNQNELDILNKELEVQLCRISDSNIERKVVKESLKSTLLFMQNMLRIKDSYQYTTIGCFAGLLIPLISNISIIFGFLIGMVIGFILDNYLNNTQRNIKTNLHDTW